MSTLETEEWKLQCFMDWTPKSLYIKCPSCLGKGIVGGGLGSLDGEQECSKCFGRREITKIITEPKPELPKALVEHMRRAWWDFFNKTGE